MYFIQQRIDACPSIGGLGQLSPLLCVKDFAAVIHPLSQLLKKDATWEWHQEHQVAFDEVKTRPPTAPVLALPNHDVPFYVVCDASNFEIWCALTQHYHAGTERVVGYL